MGMGALLEQYEETQHTQLRRGELVEGTVVLVDREEILVDIGGKMEAVIATSEIQNERGEPTLRRGDHVSAVVIVPENAEGRPVISINRARAEIGWRDLQTKKDAEEVVTGEVVDHNKGGLIVSVDGVRGFVPLSQIVELRRGGSEEEVEDKLRSMRGQTLYLKVIEMNRRRNRLILSERAAAQERRAQQKDRLLAELQAGEIRHGRVSSLTDFGAFVDLGGADGLIHLSELSWGQVAHPSQVLRVGQEVDVRVVGVDRENKKIALSLKQVEENPWNRIEQKYHVGDTVPAKITKLAQFGAFAELEPGVEGLVHISELSDERITHPKQVVREGEDVSLRIIKIDPSRHRLGLSLRQAEDAGEYDYSGGGYEAWPGGTSYVLGGSPSSAAAADGGDGGVGGEEPLEEQSVEAQPEDEETPEPVHAVSQDQPEEASAEPAANGTARVPEH
jgi:small subunit ribosomal protein S1